MSQSDLRAANPHIVFSTNASDRTFEKANCLKVVENYQSNKVFRVDGIPQSPGVRVISYAPVAYKVFIEGVVV
jgi:hypothetical protein